MRREEDLWSIVEPEGRASTTGDVVVVVIVVAVSASEDGPGKDMGTPWLP